MYKFFLIALLLFVSCKKEEDAKPVQHYGDVTFYADDPHRWVLIVDGVEHGQLTYSSQTPFCGHPNFINMSLTAGNHTVDARSLDGLAWGDPRTINVPGDDCIQIPLPN